MAKKRGLNEQKNEASAPEGNDRVMLVILANNGGD